MHIAATFDLYNADDYTKAYEVLEKKLGLVRKVETLKGMAKTPSTTVVRDVGNTSPDTTGYYNAIVETLRGAGFTVTRLMVLTVTGYAITAP